MRRMHGLAAAIIGVVVFAAPVLAVTTAFWRLSTQAEFEKGKIDHTAIANDGTLALSPEYAQVPQVSALFVWSLAQDSAFNIYAGAGDKGVIYKITGKGLSAGEFCKLPGQHVLSLAFDRAGNLFAGTAPRGVIYKIAPSGQARVFAETKESYVWALAWSPDGLTLYAAAGPHARIFKMPAAGGEPKVLLDSGQNHILCLAVDKEGNLYGGSEPGGLVYKVTPAGHAFVVYNAVEGDVHSLALDSAGNLYAATAAAGEVSMPMGGRGMGALMMPEGAVAVPPLTGEGLRTGPPPTARRAMPRAAPGGLLPEMFSPAPPPPTVSVKNSIYKIAPDGRVTQVLTLDRTMILCLAVVGSDLWAGTGNDSKLYRISLSDPSRYELVMDPEELQVISLLPLAPNSPQGALAIGTGNAGHVYGMKGSFAQSGTFVSAVFDATTISRWGEVSWEGDLPPGTSLSVATRTGNSEKPDKAWSDWSWESSSSGGERIQSPPARFIQLRATLASSAPEKSPRIREIKVPYLGLNMPPVITKLTLDGATGETTEAEKPATAPPAGGGSTMAERIAKMVTKAAAATTKAAALAPLAAHKVERAISWEAKDPDGDKLQYKLFYRGVGEKEWKLLKDDLTTTSTTWDTETVPDGEYELKVVASDSPSNPPDRALTAEKISEPILIDNTRPVVESLKATPSGDGQWKIRGRAVDALSIVVAIQYSVDAKEWVSIDPTSGIFDSKTAEFEFTLKGLSKGEHTVVVKATDAAGNPGLGKIVFR